MPLKHPLFVGRAESLERYRNAILRYADGQHTHQIWNLHAITGMGKTWFMRALFEDPAVQSQCTCIWFSFEPESILPYPAPDLQIFPAATAIPAILQRLPKPRAYTDHMLPAGLATFSTGVEYIASSGTCIVVFLDSLNMIEQLLDHDASNEAWDALQEQFVKPLIDQKALIIAASQGPLVWTFWELSQLSRPGPERLFPFEPTETEALVKQYVRGSHAAIIHELTYGHPASIMAILRYQLETDTSPSFDWPGRAVSEEEIQQRIDDLEPENQAILPYLGILRRVDVHTVRIVLDHQQPQSAPHLPWQSRNLIAAYARSGLIAIDRANAIYRFDPGIRMMSIAKLRTSSQEYALIPLFRELAVWYVPDRTPEILREHIHKYPDNLIEWVYCMLSQLALRLTTEDRTCADEIDAWPAMFGSVWSAIDDTRIHTYLANVLVNDPEIRELLQQLGLYDSIYRIVQPDMDTLRQPAQHYRDIAFDHLFRQRLTHRIAERDRAILIRLARHPSGFDRDMLRTAIIDVYGSTIDPTPSQIRAYLTVFSQISAISYDPIQRRFVMNDWLRKFLAQTTEQTNASSTGAGV